MTATPSPRSDPQRLLKVWLPVNDIRQMDALIRESNAYASRDEFVLEAVRDRVGEETVGRHETSQRPHVITDEPPSTQDKRLGIWESRGVRTAPGTRAHGMVGGMHNRDYPTLWAADLLASWVATRGEPVSWLTFTGRAASAGWTYGEELATDDDERPMSAMKAATGFPRAKSVGRRLASEQRFVEHMVGSLRQGRAKGPIFAFGLAGVVEGDAIAPTKSALKLLQAVGAAGLGPRPPHPPAAWAPFRDHLRKQLPEDLAILTRVLSGVADQPTTEELLGMFASEWPGAMAQTNVGGYVSRAREWGLVEPKLVDTRYRLTKLGQAELAGGI